MIDAEPKEVSVGARSGERDMTAQIQAVLAVSHQRVSQLLKAS